MSWEETNINLDLRVQKRFKPFTAPASPIFCLSLVHLINFLKMYFGVWTVGRTTVNNQFENATLHCGKLGCEICCSHLTDWKINQHYATTTLAALWLSADTAKLWMLFEPKFYKMTLPKITNNSFSIWLWMELLQKENKLVFLHKTFVNVQLLRVINST